MNVRERMDRLVGVIDGMLNDFFSKNDDPEYDPGSCAFLDIGTQCAVVPLAMLDDKYKAKTVLDGMVQRLVKANPDLIVAFLNAGWKKDITNTHRIGEVVIVNIEHKSGKSCILFYEVTRNEGAPPTLGHKQISYSDWPTEGAMCNYFHLPNKEGALS